MDEEKKLEKRLANWWYYRKWSAVVLLAVLVVMGYLIALNSKSISYDFYVGVVTKEQMPPEKLEALQTRLNGAAWDTNHDNEVRVLIWNYVVDLNPDSTEPGEQTEIGRLDADLAGKMSGLFLVDNPQGAREVLAPLDGEAIPVDGTDLYAILPTGHMGAKVYQTLLDHLENPIG